MPCRPGPTPVRTLAWFVSVTLGNSATAPPAKAQPCSSSRPTAGSWPFSVIASRSLQFAPSHSIPTTWPAPAATTSVSGSPSIPGNGTPQACAIVAATSITRLARGSTPARGDPGAGQQQRRAGLAGVERTVLTGMAAAFRPVVTRGVDDHQIRGPIHVLEDPGQPAGGVRVGIAGIRRGRIGQCGGQAARRAARPRDGIGELTVQDGPVAAGAWADGVPGGVGHVQGRAVHPRDQVDDRGEPGVEQDLEGGRSNDVSPAPVGAAWKEYAKRSARSQGNR